MRTNAPRLRLVALVAFEVGAAVVLHRMGEFEWLRIPWTDLPAWLSSTNAEDALAAVIRLAALAVVYWMLLTTAVYLVARATRLPSALRAVEWATLPAVRRLIDGAVAVSIATATVAGPVAPAVADDAVPTPVVIEIDDEGRPVPPGLPDQGGGAPPEATEDGTETTPPRPRPAGAGRSGWTPRPAGLSTEDARSSDAGASSSERTHASVVVERGDHLWSIAADRLRRDRGTPSTDEIARYWRRVIELNHDRIRSGDPDLIYPGETILLPPADREAP